jgi:hypothetical protein
VLFASVIRMIKSMRMRMVVRVARKGTREAPHIVCGKARRKDFTRKIKTSVVG